MRCTSYYYIKICARGCACTCTCILTYLLMITNRINPKMTLANYSRAQTHQTPTHTNMWLFSQKKSHDDVHCILDFYIPFLEKWKRIRLFNLWKKRVFLQHTATPLNTLQHTATNCNTLQHTVTHYINTLQHTATHVCSHDSSYPSGVCCNEDVCNMCTSDTHTGNSPPPSSSIGRNDDTMRLPSWSSRNSQK